LKSILRYQRRGYAWYYWSQWLGDAVTIAAALFALVNAILLLLPVQWLIVVVAFCSGFAQLAQAILQIKMNPPRRNPSDELLHNMTKKSQK